MIKINKHKFEKSCNPKNIVLDKQLSDYSETQWAFPNEITLKQLTRRGQPGAMMDYTVKTMNLQYVSLDAHSVIFVKHPGISKYGFAIFDPNSAEHFPFYITDDKGNDITKDIVSIISPTKSINNDVSENPGFCNIFGIIFMTFYKSYRDYMPVEFKNGNWLNNWREVLNCFEKAPIFPENFSSHKHSEDSKATRGLEFALHLQKIILDTKGDKQLMDLIDAKQPVNILSEIEMFCSLSSESEK